MNLPSVPSSAAASSLTPVFSPVLQFSIALRYLEEDRIIAKTTRNVRISRSLKSLVVSSGFPYPRKKRFDFLFPAESSSRRRLFLACVSDSSSGGKHNFNTELASSTRRGAKNIVIKRFSDEDANIGLGTGGDGKFASSFREDPIVDKLRTQLGVIHPLPSPPISGNVAGLFVIFFFGVLFDKLWTRVKRARSERRSLFMWPQLPTASISTLLEKDLPRKESVEWVNMVLGKLWKVYKGGIENWIIGLLQPVIDDLEKPDYVQRVEIKQFSLGDAPLSVRSVERKTSRRANDLQYQIGIRYTGDARILLMLSLKFGIIPIAVPVGVRDFDIDGVLWVKLQLIPTEPWVGAVQWAFVTLPKIKFELSPFRLFNLMAIPVVSMFLTKLLTEDLPRLFVRPKKIVLDFQKGQAVGPVTDDLKSGDADDLKSGEINEKNNDYSGELSVTLVDACNLSYMFYGKTDPYVILKLGDQTICSKKNSQTTVIGPPGEPIWNQDFYLLVTNPHKQKLSVEVRDSIGFTEVTIGTGEVDLSILEDTVPTDRIIALKGGWGLFTKGNCGEILLRLTYRAYVEDEEDDWRQKGSAYSDVSEDDISDLDEDDSVTNKMMQGDFVKEEIDKDSFMDVLAALIVSEEFQGIVASETGSDKTVSSSTIPSTRVRTTESPLSKSESGQEDSNVSPVLLWLAVVTSVAVLIAINISGSSIFNP